MTYWDLIKAIKVRITILLRTLNITKYMRIKTLEES
jgi:hypothetical protein